MQSFSVFGVFLLQSERLLVMQEWRHAAQMASTFTKILVHIAFSTKHRAAMIPNSIEPRLYAYIGGICRAMKSPLLAMNGVADHVHMFVSLGKRLHCPISC